MHALAVLFFYKGRDIYYRPWHTYRMVTALVELPDEFKSIPGHKNVSFQHRLKFVLPIMLDRGRGNQILMGKQQ